MVSRITVYSTYIDSTIARPLMTTFGGTCCSPSALRSRLSTTTILVNEVTITATNGASARLTTVIRTSAGSRLLKSMRSEEHTSEPQSLMRISYAVFCLKKKKTQSRHTNTQP